MPTLDSAELQDTPFVIVLPRNGLALRACPLLNPCSESTQRNLANCLSQLVDQVVTQGFITLIDPRPQGHLQGNQSVDAGGLGVEEAGDAALFLQREDW